MALINRINDLRESLTTHGVDAKTIGEALIQLLKKDAEMIVELHKGSSDPSGNPKRRSTDALDKRVSATEERAKTISPSKLKDAISIEVKRRRIEKTMAHLQKIQKGTANNKPLYDFLEKEISQLESDAKKLTHSKPLSDADLETINTVLRERGLDKDIDAQAQEKARIHLMASPTYAGQRKAVLEAYEAVSTALNNNDLNQETLSDLLDKLATHLPAASAEEAKSADQLKTLTSLIPSFSLREHVPELNPNSPHYNSDIQDKDIPSELIELQSRCAALQSKAAKLDEIASKASSPFSTPEEKAQFKADTKRTVTALADEVKAFNVFLRKHAHGALKAVEPTQMQAIINGHHQLVKNLSVKVKELELSNVTLVKELLRTIYVGLLTPFDVIGNVGRIIDDVDSLFENNLDSRHMPVMGAMDPKFPAAFYEISPDASYLTKNSNNSFTTTVKFHGKTTDENRAARKEISEMFESEDFNLPPNPPNSSDPDTQKFSTRQALIDEFGQRWVDKNVKNKPNGGIRIKFKDKEIPRITKVLKKRNEEYNAWQKKNSLSATMHGKPDKNETLQASLGGRPSGLTSGNGSTTTPSAPPIEGPNDQHQPSTIYGM